MSFKFLTGRKKATASTPHAAVELLSIHIPKTAGTSFRNMLKHAYGESEVARVDINHKLEIRVNDEPYNNNKPPTGAKVLHGHFNHPKIHHVFGLPNDTPTITWLRDPVDRVISNYYYMEEMLIKQMRENSNHQIRIRMQKTLVEYASVKANQNVTAQYCQGVDLQDFLFVGITEHFSEDAISLSNILRGPAFKEVHKNTSLRTPSTVSIKDRNLIESMNKMDVELYQYALELRNKRISQK